VPGDLGYVPWEGLFEQAGNLPGLNPTKDLEDEYDFYESYDLPVELGELRQVVREWEYICNFLRPSRSLGGKTPWEYLMENHRGVVSFDAKLSQMIP